MGPVNSSKKELSQAAGSIGLGAAMSMALTLLGAALGAILLSAQTLQPEQLHWLRYALWAIAGFAGSLLGSARIGKRRLQVCLATGGAYYICLLLVGLLFFGGGIAGAGEAAAAIGVGCAAVAFLSLPGKKRTMPRYRKKAYR